MKPLDTLLLPSGIDRNEERGHCSEAIGRTAAAGEAESWSVTYARMRSGYTIIKQAVLK